jgi:2-dehydro-3-deoxy-D-arabinonate dehydratase
MQLTRYQTPAGPRWSGDGCWLSEDFTLALLLGLPSKDLVALVESVSTRQPADGPLLAPVEDTQEVWASGVTYLRSREARQVESEVGDVYDRVYMAQRPELFFKASGWRVLGPNQPLRCRADSEWNVPEPELALVINRYGEIVGYTAGNDMSSRSIEGQNPLYLPQAKIYNGSCSLGPAIQLLQPEDRLQAIPVEIAIRRAGVTVFQGNTSTANMNRTMEDLVAYLMRELDFPQGVFLLTGTGIVPPDDFTLAGGDDVIIQVGNLTLANPIGA